MPKFSQDASKSSPNPPKIDPKAIQKASWNPSWTTVLKRYDLERPRSSQNAPKSGPKTLQSVPNPSQMEPKPLPNQIFEQVLRLFFLVVNLHCFFCSFVAEFVCFCKSRPLKFMRPRSVLLTSTRFGMFRKKYQKSSKNLPETFPTSRNIPGKIEKNQIKSMEKAKMSEESQQMRYKFEKSANLRQFEAPEPKVTLPRRDGEPPLSTP